MPGHSKLGPTHRLVAAALALVWACAGLAGCIAAYVYGRWALAWAGLFALWFAVLWARVALRARLLTWREAVTPWRIP
ncbi:hypothetical protein [Geothrix oryzisoli]|uniref:hypothetical protein n=1 Tax=Geothrix oryzisoli TaxID=2922721 RepID=UPI001FACC0BE|nr:hypothetical protein [Geothrix oryzisoli]